MQIGAKRFESGFQVIVFQAGKKVFIHPVCSNWSDFMKKLLI